MSHERRASHGNPVPNDTNNERRRSQRQPASPTEQAVSNERRTSVGQSTANQRRTSLGQSPANQRRASLEQPDPNQRRTSVGQSTANQRRTSLGQPSPNQHRPSLGQPSPNQRRNSFGQSAPRQRRPSQNRNVHPKKHRKSSQTSDPSEKTPIDDLQTSTPGVYPGGYTSPTEHPPEEYPATLEDIQHYGGYPDNTEGDEETENEILEIEEDEAANVKNSPQEVMVTNDQTVNESYTVKSQKVHLPTDDDYYNCACCRMSPRALLITISSIGMVLGILFLGIGTFMNYGKRFGVSLDIGLVGPKPECDSSIECSRSIRTWNSDNTAYRMVAYYGYIGHGFIMVVVSGIVLILLFQCVKNLLRNCCCRWTIVLITIPFGIMVLIIQLLTEVYVICASFESQSLWIRLLALPPLAAYNLFWALIQLKSDSKLELPPEDSASQFEDVKVKQSFYVNLCCCKCIKRDDVRDSYLGLFPIVLDWLLDFGIGTMHIVKGKWVSGLGTYFIVLYAGIIITFTNFSPLESRNNLAIVKDEIRKMGRFYGFLMYVPSFFPICSAKLRLYYALKLRDCKDEVEYLELRRKMEIVKDQALWDNCCESFFESIPQAVLQIVVLFRAKFDSITEYVPIASVFWSIYGITGSPISVLQERHKDVKMSLTERLTAYASTALRVFSVALAITAILTFLVAGMDESEEWKEVLLWLVVGSIGLFCLLCGPQIIKYELGQMYPTWSLCHTILCDAFMFLVTLSCLYVWMIAEILVLKTKLDTWTWKLMAVVVFSCLMFFSCAGVLLFRRKLELYHSTTATVLLNCYLGIKCWILGTCCKKSHPNVRRVSVSM